MFFGGNVPGPFGGTAGLQCVTGSVYLYRFITAPTPGSVIGQVRLLSGATLPLVQTQATPLGGISLSSVDGQFATLCGVYTNVGGQIVLDVRVVNPGAPSPTGTPYPYNIYNWLLYLLGGGFGGGAGTGVGSRF